MVVPHDVDTECVEAHGLDHLQTVLPVFHGNSGIMHLACYQLCWGSCQLLIDSQLSGSCVIFPVNQSCDERESESSQEDEMVLHISIKLWRLNI